MGSLLKFNRPARSSLLLFMAVFVFGIGFLFLNAKPVEAAIAFVNAVAAKNDASGGNLTTGTLNVTAGNLLVAACRINSVSQTPTFSDLAVNTWVDDGVVDQGTTRMKFWHAYNVTGNASDTFTCGVSPNVDFRAITVTQYSGVHTSSDPLDTSATASCANCNPGSLTSNAFTTTQADEVIVYPVTVQTLGATFTAGTGYTLATSAQADYVHTEYKIVSSIQTGVTANITWNAPSAAQPKVLMFF